MRLDKLLANMGYGSRKDVKQLLKKKKVQVNEKTITDGSQHVDPNEDIVTVNGEQVIYREFIYLMLHKPPGYISATEDNIEKTVIDLLPEQYLIFQPFPVGRLDKDTEGLLLITNDGKLAHELVSPKKNIEKMYYAKIKGKVTEEDQKKFWEGILLDDGYRAKPAKLKILSSEDISEVEVTVTEGKYHQVKRMFEATGKKVTYLKRLQMGPLQLDPSLPRGSVRELTKEELAACLALKNKRNGE